VFLTKPWTRIDMPLKYTRVLTCKTHLHNGSDKVIGICYISK